MATSASSLLSWITIPAGTFNGRFLDSFRLTHTPITNAQYRAHVDQYQAEPFVFDSHRNQLLLNHRHEIDPPQSRHPGFGFRAASAVLRSTVCPLARRTLS